MAVWRLQVNTGGANVADYCLQNHVAALWAGKVLAYLMADLRKNHLDTYAYFFTKVITKPKNYPYHLKPANTLIKRL